MDIVGDQLQRLIELIEERIGIESQMAVLERKLALKDLEIRTRRHELEMRYPNTELYTIEGFFVQSINGTIIISKDY